ncbi:MAG: hypothetical protein AAFU67_09650 [Bacteroidota bacterium]
MKKALSLLLFSCLVTVVQAAVPFHSTAGSDITTKELTLEDIRTLKNKELKQKLGRKLTFAESIVYPMMRRKFKLAEKRAQRRAAKGKTAENKDAFAEVALGFSLTGWMLLIIALVSNATTAGIAFILLLLGTILGGVGKGKYRGKNEKKFFLSNLAFWLGLVPIAITLGLLLIFATTY